MTFPSSEGQIGSQQYYPGCTHCYGEVYGWVQHTAESEQCSFRMFFYKRLVQGVVGIGSQTSFLASYLFWINDVDSSRKTQSLILAAEFAVSSRQGGTAPKGWILLAWTLLPRK